MKRTYNFLMKQEKNFQLKIETRNWDIAQTVKCSPLQARGPKLEPQK